MNVRAVDEIDRIGPPATARIAPAPGVTNGSNSIALDAQKNGSALSFGGVLSPSSPGANVTVTLLKKNGAVYERVNRISVRVRTEKGAPTSSFGGSFVSPGRGKCRIRAYFSGGPSGLPVAMSRNVRC